jgi:CHAT domain
MARELPDYDELEIRLTPGRAEDVYNVDVVAASGARGHGSFAAPSELEVKRFRLMVDPRNRRIRHRSQYAVAAQQFGTRLFAALLGDGSARDVYTAARRDASAAGRGLRIVLSLPATSDLAGIPWEFLRDPPWFLAKRIKTPVVRLVDRKDPSPPLRVEPPLRILGMVSRPSDDALAGLDAEAEQAALQRRLAPLIEAGMVSVRWLERATLPALQQEADHGEDFHIFHYIGHGEYDEDSGESSLILERDDRRPQRVDGDQLGTVLCDRGSLRLAVLNACEAAQTAPQDPLAGVATSLMEYDVPAVVAMQFAITDDGALTFADEFYRALAYGYPVDAAVTQARRALAAHSDVEWGTPVLFMRVADGRLFDVHRAASARTPDGAGLAAEAQFEPAARAEPSVEMTASASTREAIEVLARTSVISGTCRWSRCMSPWVIE